MKDSLETRLGVFVALALIAGVLVLEMGGGMDRFRRGSVFTRISTARWNSKSATA